MSFDRKSYELFGSVDPGAARQLFANLITHLPIPQLWATIDAMNAKPGRMGHILGQALAPSPFGEGLYPFRVFRSRSLDQMVNSALRSVDINVADAYVRGVWSEGAWLPHDPRDTDGTHGLAKLFQLDLHHEYARDAWYALENPEHMERYLRSDAMGFRSLTLQEFVAMLFTTPYFRVPVTTIGATLSFNGGTWYPYYYQDERGKRLGLAYGAPRKGCFYAVTPFRPKK